MLLDWDRDYGTTAVEFSIMQCNNYVLCISNLFNLICNNAYFDNFGAPEKISDEVIWW